MYKTLVKSKLTNVTAISKRSNFGKNFSKTDWKIIFTLPLRTRTETEWISNKFDRHISFDIKSILFGKFGNQNIYKYDYMIILTIKNYICRKIYVPYEKL